MMQTGSSHWRGDTLADMYEARVSTMRTSGGRAFNVRLSAARALEWSYAWWLRRGQGGWCRVRWVRGVGDVVRMGMEFQSMRSLGNKSKDFGIYSKNNGKPLEMEAGCPVSTDIKGKTSRREKRLGWKIKRALWDTWSVRLLYIQAHMLAGCFRLSHRGLPWR